MGHHTPSLLSNSGCGPPEAVGLPNQFYSELNLSWIRSEIGQQTGTAIHCAVAIYHVCVARTQIRHIKIGVVQDIEELRPELYIEALRNPPDVVALNDGKVKIRQARSNQCIAADIASEVEARVRRQPCRSWVAAKTRPSIVSWVTRVETVPEAGRLWVAVRRPKRRTGRHRHREATGLGIDVHPPVISEIQVNWIASGHNTRIGIIVTAERTPGVPTLRPKKSAEGNTVIGFEDSTQLPSA
jgi:hypothetical protein